MGIDLPLIWAVIIIFGIMMYVVMDGFDPVSYTHLTLPTICSV